jgi:dTDP-glucose 4,6-dehydratase
MIRLLVCGGAGFIGTNFVYYMLEKYPAIVLVVYDKLTYAGNAENFASLAQDSRYHFVQGDITDLSHVLQVISQHNITHIINFAAETHVDRSIHGSAREFVLTNTLGVQMLLEAVRLHGIEKFVHVSTDEVYGSLQLDGGDKFTEDSPIRPNTPYAAAKAGGDVMCHAYWVTHNVPVVVTRCSNNYGPYQFPEKLLPFFIFKILRGEKVPLYGDGQNVRDWIHVYDHITALDLLLQRGQPGAVYNIGADNERSNLEITLQLLALFNLGEEQIEYVTDRPGHDRRYAIDATKVISLGWQPDYPREHFDQGLQQTIMWYKEHSAWLENIWQRQPAELNSFQAHLPRSNEKMEPSTN